MTILQSPPLFSPELPFRATAAQACAWLSAQTGAPWNLPRLIGCGLTPYVWLDYDATRPELFGEANGGYPAPIFFEGDTQRLIDGSDDVLITMTKDAYGIVARLQPPGLRLALQELRFLRKDVQKLPKQLQRAAAPAVPETQAAPAISQAGIDRQQVLSAFAGLAKLDLARALDEAGGMFGDDGARIAVRPRKGKHTILWNPITLALGFNEVYRVPMPRLKRAFATHACLADWADEWEHTLSLLGA